MTAKREGTGLSGWCITGHHVGKATETSDECRVETCTCECHGRERE